MSAPGTTVSFLAVQLQEPYKARVFSNPSMRFFAALRSNSAGPRSVLSDRTARPQYRIASPELRYATLRANRDRQHTVKHISARTQAVAGEAADSGNMEQFQPGSTVIGFAGIGIMGLAMANNLIKAGYNVVVWNRSADKCRPLVDAGAKQAGTPKELAEQCDVTFAMLSDPEAAEKVACGEGGIAEGISGRCYIDVSTVDAATSTRISQAVTAAGGRFLEAPVSGSKAPAEQGTLIFLCAGDETLFHAAQPPLDVMGKRSFFLGAIGSGARMKLVVNLVMGGMMASLAEGLALADCSGLSKTDLVDVLGLGAMACGMVTGKAPGMAAGKYPTAFPLKHQQKDMRLALQLGDESGVTLPVAAAANAQFIRARAQGHGDDDFSAVMEAVLSQK